MHGLENGEVLASGSNEHFALGFEADSTVFEFTRCLGDLRFTDIACSWTHSLGVSSTDLCV
jgi:hypothetical protein